jgi:MFS family permease
MLKAFSKAGERFKGRLAFGGVLRHRNYRLYWLGHFLSSISLSMDIVAQSWLVLRLTNSPFLLGANWLVHAIPSITLALLGGVIADRMDRRRILVVAQAGATALYFVLGTLVLAGVAEFWHVLVMTFLAGGLRAFDRPGRLALLPQVVPRDELASAVAVSSFPWQFTRLIGPASAGMLIYLVDVGLTYYVCALIALVGSVLWPMIRLEAHAPAKMEESFVQHITEGLNFVRRHEIYYIFIAMTFFNSVFGMSYMTLAPLFARDILHVGSQGYGFLQSSAGAGALVGVILVSFLAGVPRKGRQIMAGAITFGLCLIGFAFSTSYLLSITLVFLIGVTSQTYITTITTVLQLELPEDLRGRVMGIYGLAWDLMPVGGVIVGTIAEYAGAPMAVAVGGFLVSGSAVLVVVRSPNIRNLN